ncbi:MAG: CpaE family protein, partial [Candidatus Korobacteraceae bacterium]
VDMAVLGHAALHLNVKPAFTVADAARNLQRLDSTLLQQFMVRCGDGLQFLAAPEHSESLGFAQPGIQQIVDVLAGGFEYVLVDLSTRLDLITSSMAAISDRVLITAHADVPSLWSASRIRKTFTFQSEEQVQLVLNRFEKIPGFSDSEIEAATNMRLFWKVPNQYEVVSQAVNRGTPVVMQKNLEITKSFAGLAEALATQGSEKRRATSLFAFTH